MKIEHATLRTVDVDANDEFMPRGACKRTRAACLSQRMGFFRAALWPLSYTSNVCLPSAPERMLSTKNQ